MPRSLRLAVMFTLAAFGVGLPAHARDLEKAPTGSMPVPCPSKGQGFVRMPGSQSCIRVSGRVAAGVDLRAGQAIGPSGIPAVTGRLAIDNRTDSDLGEVRTYVRIGNGRR